MDVIVGGGGDCVCSSCRLGVVSLFILQGDFDVFFGEVSYIEIASKSLGVRIVNEGWRFVCAGSIIVVPRVASADCEDLGSVRSALGSHSSCCQGGGCVPFKRRDGEVRAVKDLSVRKTIVWQIAHHTHR